jgi:uridine kinase
MIKVIVAGSANSGKSSVIKLIQKALEENGIECFVNDEFEMSEINLPNALQSLRDINLKVDISSL